MITQLYKSYINIRIISRKILYDMTVNTLYIPVTRFLSNKRTGQTPHNHIVILCQVRQMLTTTHENGLMLKIDNKPRKIMQCKPSCIIQKLAYWNAKRSTDKRWEALWIALSMTIWKHRNSMVFNNQLFIPEKVMDEALFHTWSWLRCMEKDFNTHFNHWSSNLREEFSQGGLAYPVFVFILIWAVFLTAYAICCTLQCIQY